MDPLKNILLAGLGAMSYTTDRLKGAIQGLVDKGDLTREQGERVISEWVARGEQETGKISDRVGDEVKKVLERLSMVTREELRRSGEACRRTRRTR